MSADDALERGRPPLKVRAEAATWLALLGGPSRSPELEERFAKWLAEREPHRIAWERVADAWDLSGGLAKRITPLEEAPGRPQRRRRLLAVASALLLCAALAVGVLLPRRGTVSTGIGERRVVSLQDGTRITLNTDTRVVVRYDAKARRVRLEHGEALFQVAHDPAWPFVVTAGGHEIVALGTAFEVRRFSARKVAITLVEGRISIAPEGAGTRPAQRDAMVLVSPGERLTFAPHRAPRLDRPALGEIIAWQSGEVVFDHTRLADAAREMNRYSRIRIVIADPRVASLEVSGLFQAGDSTEFAAGVAATFGLRVATRGERILLARR